MSIDNVADLPSRAQYEATAGQDEFAYPFPIFQDADLVVEVDGAVQTLVDDYTVSGATDDTGGYVTFNTPLEGGEIVTIYRETAIDRTSDFPQNGPWFSEATNDEFDRLFIIAQEQRQALQRSIRFPMSAEQTDSGAELSPIANWRGRYLYINDDGQLEPAAAVSLTTLTQAILSALMFAQYPEESAVPVVPTYFIPPLVVTPERYGAVGDGVTDDTLAIRAAQSVLDEAGGGTLEFGHGKVYLLSTVTTHSVKVPVAGPNFTTATENHQCHVLIQDKSNIRWNLNGSKLKSTITNGGEMFILDGVRNFEVLNGEFESVTDKDSGTGAVTTTGMGVFGVTSQTRDSYNLSFRNIIATNVYYPLYVFGDPLSSFRAYGISIDGLRHQQGIYTLAFHDNGDDVVARGVMSVGALREYFIYGVSNHNVQIYGVSGTAGFSTVIKAYDRDTTQIRLQLRTRKNISQPNVHLQSQHAPSVQATPCRLISIHLDINNQGVSGLGPAVAFEYYRDAVLTATSTNNLWTGIKLSGIHEQAPVVSSTQNSAGATGTLNTDDLVLLNGSLASIYSRTGLVDSKQRYSTFTPVVKINGSATGITGTFVGEYWRDGQFVEALYRVTLTSKGAGAGTVTLDLPIQSNSLNSGNAVVRGIAVSNVASISGALTGFVANSGSTLTLQVQGATGASALTDANLTNTSDLQIHIRYPI